MGPRSRPNAIMSDSFAVRNDRSAAMTKIASSKLVLVSEARVLQLRLKPRSGPNDAGLVLQLAHGQPGVRQRRRGADRQRSDRHCVARDDGPRESLRLTHLNRERIFQGPHR